jgi:hypothetical protein
MYFHLVSAGINDSLCIEVVLDKSTCAIHRAVIYYDEMEVLILLHQDRADVPFGSFSRFIVEGRHNDAEWQLFVLVNMVFLDVIVPLFVGECGRTSGVLSDDESPLFNSF